MRKSVVIGLVSAMLVPALAGAQTPGDMRYDQHRVEREQRDLRRDVRDGAPPAVIRQDARDVRIAHQAYRDDWRDYRRQHPDFYRGPAWVGPRGYAYHPVPVGYRFQPAFYERHYWVDPYRYHLRPVYGSQRWVRYGHDVALVDLRDGRVIEMNSGFFF